MCAISTFAIQCHEMETNWGWESPVSSIELPTARFLLPGRWFEAIATDRSAKLRKEVEIMEKLVHRHIVSLVGSYISSSRQNRLYLLLYPAATCDLKTFLQDCDDIRQGNSAHLVETSRRFESLGFRNFLRNHQTDPQHINISAVSWHEPLKYLRSILGCITEAITFIHQSKVRHLDLKPENILLMPKRAYLADFGISRDLEDASNSLTEGYAGGTRMYQSPETYEKREHHMSPSEIYSLGAIFLGIATVLYGESQSQFDSIMKESESKLKASRITGFLNRLRNSACEQDRRTGEHDNDQGHIIDLVETMLDYEPEKRPTALEVNHCLTELGGQKQIYHEECCQKSAVQLASLRGSIIKSLETEKVTQAQEIKSFRAELNALKERGDANIHALEKQRDSIARELEKVRNGFDARIESEKMGIASLWIRRLEVEKKEHDASKMKIENAEARLRNLEEENQRLRGARKDKRNQTQISDNRKAPSLSNGKVHSGGRSTPSRLPVMRNSSSPLAPPKPFDSSTKRANAKSESDLTVKLKTPSPVPGNDDSDSYSVMAASGMTLVESVSSVSPRSASPPSPLTSKSVNIEVPKISGVGESNFNVKKLNNASKSYADMLRPTLAVKSGSEKNTLKPVIPLSLRGPGVWNNKSPIVHKTQTSTKERASRSG